MGFNSAFKGLKYFYHGYFSVQQYIPTILMKGRSIIFCQHSLPLPLQTYAYLIVAKIVKKTVTCII